MGDVAEAEEFPEDERFELRDRIGSGGMGTVWAAWDRERSLEVALKTLRTPDPRSIYRFKREFRAMAGVTHPNLVTLHELFAREGQWFFTMELLEGTDVMRHLRGGVSDTPSTSSEAETVAARPTPEHTPTIAASHGNCVDGPALRVRAPRFRFRISAACVMPWSSSSRA